MLVQDYAGSGSGKPDNSVSAVSQSSTIHFLQPFVVSPSFLIEVVIDSFTFDFVFISGYNQ